MAYAAGSATGEDAIGHGGAFSRRVGVMQHGSPIFLKRFARRAACLLVAATGCGPAPEKKLTNPDASGKIPAIKRAALSRDFMAAPRLVEELESDDPAVRFYAIQALRRLAGEDLGYRYYDDDDRREPAVKRWRDWLAGRQGGGVAASAKP